MQNKENTGSEEMSVQDKRIPRYYKGFDMDDIIYRLRNKETLAEEESDALYEARKIYYELFSKKMEREFKNKAEGQRVTVFEDGPVATLKNNG